MKTQIPCAYVGHLSVFRQFLLSKRYSANTIKNYTEALSVVIRFMANKPPPQLNLLDIIHFNNEYILKKGHSVLYQNQMVNAIKMFLKITENRAIKVEDIHRPSLRKTKRVQFFQTHK